jgi:hypothetical protein
MSRVPWLKTTGFPTPRDASFGSECLKPDLDPIGLVFRGPNGCERPARLSEASFAQKKA